MDKSINVREHNRRAWDCQVGKGDRWTIPVTCEDIANARCGKWEIVLTPVKPVPRDWFGDLQGKKILGLASGGGQQCPILAAAGAEVTLLDNSPAQLAQDKRLAERENLQIHCIEGDMTDLSMFENDSFDLIFHPVSNCFVQDIREVWKQAFRVLRPGGELLSGFCQPILFLFDDAKMEKGELEVRHSIPYSDLTSISENERISLYGKDEPLSFGHSFDDQIGGQIDAGFFIVGLYEDYWQNDGHILNKFTASIMATRARIPH